MENLLLTLQCPPNNEVRLNDEVNGGEDESCSLTKKDVDDILAKAKEEDILDTSFGPYDSLKYLSYMEVPPFHPQLND